jgi:hypothetical protein
MELPANATLIDVVMERASPKSSAEPSGAENIVYNSILNRRSRASSETLTYRRLEQEVIHVR